MVSMGEKVLFIEGIGSYSGWRMEYFHVVKTFPDVPSNAWYAGVVGRAAMLGLINGYADGNFGPNNPITRAQVAVVLWNMAGKPYASSGAKWFSDVQPGKYYFEAVRWASAAGVVSGYDNGLFGSADNVTREQLAVMLASYAQRVCYLNAWGSFSDFSWMYDAGQVSSWAVSSVGWCFNKGILSGSGNRIRPQGSASRAEASKMVVGLYDLVT